MGARGKEKSYYLDHLLIKTLPRALQSVGLGYEDWEKLGKLFAYDQVLCQNMINSYLEARRWPCREWAENIFKNIDSAFNDTDLEIFVTICRLDENGVKEILLRHVFQNDKVRFNLAIDIFTKLELNKDPLLFLEIFDGSNSENMKKAVIAMSKTNKSFKFPDLFHRLMGNPVFRYVLLTTSLRGQLKYLSSAQITELATHEDLELQY
jgi:hypothetical protein